jgi:predicted glycoside hydrolase/deacetylase ChbG (UPF0249 family)
MRIIINADDLGFSENINNQIFALMSRGVVTSATILANGPAFEQAIGQVSYYNQCSFGVHLNVVEFRPLTSNSWPAAVLNDDGEFNGRLSNMVLGRFLRQAICSEWCAQIEKVKSYGLNISHLDSHWHFHTSSGIFTVLKTVQQHFGIRKVRNTWTIYPSNARPPRTLLLKKKLWNLALRRYFSTKTTSGFTNLMTFLEAAKTKRLSQTEIEVMVHPGHTAEPRFIEETRILQNDWSAEIPFDFKLISYHEL